MIFTPSDSVWNEVQDLLRRGISPVIELTEADRLRPPADPVDRKKARKPHKDRLPHPWANYRMLTQNGRPMTCRNPGCRNYLKRHTECVTCSDNCREELTHRCEQLLGIMRGEICVEELDVYYRSINVGTRKVAPDDPMASVQLRLMRGEKAA